MAVLRKTLTKTDIEKRLSIPTAKKECFLDFKGKDKVKFIAVDKNGKVWCFVCSRRKKEKSYPKPVVSKGWLQFVREWKLAILDEVILDRHQDGKGQYRIHVIKRANQNHTDRTIYSNLADNESAIITLTGSGQPVTFFQTESCSERPQSSADSFGSELKLTTISLSLALALGPLKEPIRRRGDTADSELKLADTSLRPHERLINFFASESQDQPTFPRLERPIMDLNTPYFEFL